MAFYGLPPLSQYYILLEILVMKMWDALKYYKTQPLAVRLYIAIRPVIVDFNRILGFFPADANSIMELACGYGITSFAMANRYKGTPIRSYDIDAKRIAILNSINPYRHLSFHHENILDIREFTSDVIFMSDLLHHLTYPQQENLLKRIHATAPSGVVLLIKDMDKGRYSFRQFLNYMIDILHTGEFRFSYRARDSFVGLFTSCGFKVKRTVYVNKWFIPLNHVFFILGKE
ncbi:MAG: hypothetical protein A2Z88_06485 [Omnitrophica WOR_2 bacterium GWA2_47_8]|nr:MAG: hypothetical protein A2Z88_06485 [Omnitrophica WOR_2 bacterium GWA2_47_8]